MNRFFTTLKNIWKIEELRKRILYTLGMRRRYPVLEKGRLVGQVSRKDIVIAALNMKSQTCNAK